MDLATAEVNVLGHFVAERGVGNLAIGREVVYVSNRWQIRSVPRVL